MTPRPWDAIVARRGYALVDGGLATELERHGESLDTALWSAALLAARPQAIRAVHDAFLDAGADVVIAATYQASVEGFAAAGHDRSQAASFMQRAVDLARAARDARMAATGNAARALVAASVGPYGAMLGGGAEYGGDYGVDDHVLRVFHRDRLAWLGGSGADLLAVETIPGDAEARVLAELIDETPGPPAWVSFTCRDDARLHDGCPVEQAVARFVAVARVGAVGVNCTDPHCVEALIHRIRDAAPDKDVVVYPNRGGAWDARRRTWGEAVEADCYRELGLRWYDAGARLIGGCCRTTPDLIAALARTLDDARQTEHTT